MTAKRFFTAAALFLATSAAAACAESATLPGLTDNDTEMVTGGDAPTDTAGFVPEGDVMP